MVDIDVAVTQFLDRHRSCTADVISCTKCCPSAQESGVTSQADDLVTKFVVDF